jgi:hypothetical protein
VAVDDISSIPARRTRDRHRGRSIWVLGDASPISGLDANVLASPLHAFSRSSRRSRVFAAARASGRADVPRRESADGRAHHLLAA